jgi:hypothetical protein
MLKDLISKGGGELIKTKKEQYNKKMNELLSQKKDLESKLVSNKKDITALKKESPYWFRGGKTIGLKKRLSKTMKRKLSR